MECSVTASAGKRRSTPLPASRCSAAFACRRSLTASSARALPHVPARGGASTIRKKEENVIGTRSSDDKRAPNSPAYERLAAAPGVRPGLVVGGAAAIAVLGG